MALHPLARSDEREGEREQRAAKTEEEKIEHAKTPLPERMET